MMKKIFKKTLVLMCMTSVVFATGCGSSEKDGAKETTKVETSSELTEDNTTADNATDNNTVENDATENDTTENNIVEEETQEVKMYGKGDTFELDGCTFTIDDIIFDVNRKNACAILMTVVNNSDEKYSFDSADFYADNFKCEDSYVSSFDERLDGYVSAGIESVAAGRAIKVYYDSEYPEDCTSLEAEITKGFSGKVLYKIKLK